MAQETFEIQGISLDKACFHCEPEDVSQMCETDTVAIHRNDPDIEEIILLNVSIRLRHFKTIESPVGIKTVVYAAKHIELIFQSCGVRYTSKFCIPFCTFLVQDCFKRSVKNVRFLIEDIDAMQLSPRSVSISCFLLAIPEYDESHRKQDAGEDDPGVRCDIKIKSLPQVRTLSEL